MTIVTPSEWLAKLVKQSFLKEYEVKVINNGIDTQVFKPRKSNFRKKYNLENKKIILGVASDWTKEKGFYDFIELSRVIDEDYRIFMVGLNDKQLKEISSNILGIKRTENAIQLAEIYSAADVYFNPTYADNYPTTNLEALACGTPVITYNTGGSPESVKENGGIVTDFDKFKKNYKHYLNETYQINMICSNVDMLNNYCQLYNLMINRMEK